MQALAGSVSMNAASCRQAPVAAHSRQMPAVRHALATFEGMRKGSPSTASFGQSMSCRRVAISRRSAVITEAKAGARKVALLGAAGGIGQPLALLLKMQPYVAELALYDIANTVGVAADLSHCNTSVQVGDQILICTNTCKNLCVWSTSLGSVVIAASYFIHALHYVIREEVPLLMELTAWGWPTCMFTVECLCELPVSPS